MFQDGLTVGIDLGTAYSAIAHLDADGNPKVISRRPENPVTASVLAFGDSGNVRVGELNTKESFDPDLVVTAIKRHMGNAGFQLNVQNHRMTPEFLSALILRKLKQEAERQLKQPIANAVITVPYYFNEPCRKATQNAGQIAGLNVVDVINEPTAATLAYAWLNGELGRTDLGSDERRILLYDLGGGTFDVTVVKYTPTHFAVIGTDGDTFLGGLDWTERLTDHAAEELKKRFRIEVDSRGVDRMRLFDACEQAKRRLATEGETRIVFAWNGREVPVPITRRKFEELTADLLQRTMDTTELVLQDSSVGAGSLHEVLLVGGSTHMPAVQEMLRRICGREPSQMLDPRLAVAQGAAIHAAILQAKEEGASSRLGETVLKRLKAVTAQDVNSHSLGVELTNPKTSEKSNHIMIRRNSALPASVTQRFATSSASPESIRIRLLEGEVPDTTACTVVGDFRITELPSDLPAGSPVEVQYSYDERRQIHVTAHELTGNNRAEVKLVWESGVQPSAMQSFSELAASYQVE